MTVFNKLNKLFRLVGQALKGEERDYTTLSINKAILLLAIPMVAEMSMESIFAVVDIYFVGRLHDNDAVATVGLTESLLTIVYSLAMGLSMGATAMVSRRIGEKNIKGAEEAGIQAIFVGIIVSLCITVVGIFFSEDLLRIMGGSEKLIANNVGFTHWMLRGNIAIVLLFLINGVFRGAGDASIAMRALILSNVVNIVLDPIFIFGVGPIPGYGVEGAGIATTTGRSIGVMYQLYHLFKGNGILRVHVENIRLKLDVAWRIVKVSAGGTSQFLIGSASWAFLYRLVSEFGETALAGYTIALRIIVFAILPAWGMANASATLVGQNLGAGHPDRAEQSVWRAAFFNMVFLAFVTVIFFIMAPQLVGLFTVDEDALRHGTLCLKVVSLGYIFYAYGMVVGQSFNGAGDTRTPTLISFVGFWIIQIPLAYTLAHVLNVGSIGVFSAISIAESIMAVASIYIFRLGKWKTVKI